MNIDPLVEALATGDAVVFVGAGASAPAGLPLWRPFLQGLLKRAIAVSDDLSARTPDEWDRTT
jgi:hypothetical protein